MLCTYCGEHEVRSRGLCETCYSRWKRNGTPVPKIITNKQKGITECSNPECRATGVKITKGLCKKCYYRKWRTGNVDYVVRNRSICSVEGCGKVVASKGLCDTHRKRVERHGSVEAGARPDWWGDYEARKQRSQGAKYEKTIGFSWDLYCEMIKQQKGVCKICVKPERRIDSRTGKVFALSVDHCHDTGKIRGLLCMDCNAAIGFLTTTALLRSAIKYLKPHEPPHS
jgi:hypothetical protein